MIRLALFIDLLSHVKNESTMSANVRNFQLNPQGENCKQLANHNIRRYISCLQPLRGGAETPNDEAKNSNVGVAEQDRPYFYPSVFDEDEPESSVENRKAAALQDRLMEKGSSGSEDDENDPGQFLQTLFFGKARWRFIDYDIKPWNHANFQSGFK
jgi:hypothetical protein